jgi:aspartate-semialdehyde dehydrogenase
MKNKKVAVVGATGRVGREMLHILSEEGVPVKNVVAIASNKSVGEILSYGDWSVEVQSLEDCDFTSCDIALFSAGSDISSKYAPIASQNGCTVIDNTSFFRMDKDIPLIVPEVNWSDLNKYKNTKIIANPNCSTIQMVMVLKPLHDLFGLKEVVVSTYQSVSGAGQKGVDELLSQSKNYLNDTPIVASHFKKQIAFNIIPQIDLFTESLYTKEELKMMNETKKILSISDLKITATCARVPVIVSHCLSVYASFAKKVDLQEAIRVLGSFEGLKIVDDLKNYEYATPIDAASKDDVFVSRIRKHPSIENVLSFWCVSDNVRKGAALNSIQIAKKL